MKKTLLLILAALAVAFVITACSPQENAQNEAGEETTQNPVIILPRDNF